MARMPKWLLALIIVAIAALVFLLQPAPLAVDVATVERRPFSATVEDQGRTRASNPFVVASPITGRLLRSNLEEGDQVKRGQVIASVALPPQDRRTLAVAQANLLAAKARRTAAAAALAESRSTLSRRTRELKRREELFKNNLASSEEVENYRQIAAAARARVVSGEAAMDAALAEIESARSHLLGSGMRDAEKREGIEKILAPSDGTIYRVLEESERVVQAGTPLFEISNLDKLEVVVDLLTQDAVKVDSGNPVRITGWGGDHTIDAVVRYVEPEAFTKISALGVEEQRVNVIADLINPPSNLGAEYRIQAAIVIWQSDAELTIPSSAIFQRSDGWNTFVVENGQAVLRRLRIGYRGRDYTQVVAGIHEGETVILFPSDLIDDGVEVSF